MGYRRHFLSQDTERLKRLPAPHQVQQIRPLTPQGLTPPRRQKGRGSPPYLHGHMDLIRGKYNHLKKCKTVSA